MSDNDPRLMPEVRGDRGFQGMPPLDGAYGGTVRVYESSSATTPRIWLAVDHDGDGATIHLDLSVALVLADQIRSLADNHYQRPQPKPTTDTSWTQTDEATS